ncbi:unnamed protein product [Sphagnum jensenii]|uniref:Uncharacterized protein n=1 Tax=Sphagnum jensenii TaxID=128206 RepID=A0ABP1BF71_9BRYO
MAQRGRPRGATGRGSQNRKKRSFAKKRKLARKDQRQRKKPKPEEIEIEVLHQEPIHNNPEFPRNCHENEKFKTKSSNHYTSDYKGRRDQYQSDDDIDDDDANDSLEEAFNPSDSDYDEANDSMKTSSKRQRSSTNNFGNGKDNNKHYTSKATSKGTYKESKHSLSATSSEVSKASGKLRNSSSLNNRNSVSKRSDEDGEYQVNSQDSDLNPSDSSESMN